MSVANARMTTGNRAFVKVVAEDDLGDVGDVVGTQQGRSIGQWHKDATSRFTTDQSLTTLETITVRGGLLGENGAVRLLLRFQTVGASGSKEFYCMWNGSAIVTQNKDSDHTGAGMMEVVIANDGGVDAQEVHGVWFDEDPTVNLSRATPGVDTSNDVDIDVVVRANGASDAITLNLSLAELLGTN